MKRAGTIVIALTLVLIAQPVHSQDICDTRNVEDGTLVRTSWYPYPQDGLGFLRTPDGETESGSGVVRESSLVLSGRRATVHCRDGRVRGTEPQPHGFRFGFLLSNGIGTRWTGLALHGAYLRDSGSWRLWAGPELAAGGASGWTSTIGLNAGVSVFEWVGLMARPAWVIAGDTGGDSSFMYSVMLTISPEFRREVLGRTR